MRVEVPHPVKHVTRRQVAEGNAHARLAVHLDERIDGIANDAVGVVLMPVADVRVPSAQVEPVAEDDGLPFFLVADVRRDRRPEGIAEHALHRRPIKLDVVVADDEDDLVASRDEIAERLEEPRVVVDDHLHLELALPFLAPETSRAFEPVGVAFLVRQLGDGVEIEDVAVHDELDGPV